MSKVFTKVLSFMERALQEELGFEEPLDARFIGHPIPLTCGHTGQPSSEEAYLMEKHLRAAGFIYQSDKDPVAIKPISLLQVMIIGQDSPCNNSLGESAKIDPSVVIKTIKESVELPDIKINNIETEINGEKNSLSHNFPPLAISERVEGVDNNLKLN